MSTSTRERGLGEGVSVAHLPRGLSLAETLTRPWTPLGVDPIDTPAGSDSAPRRPGLEEDDGAHPMAERAHTVLVESPN